MINSILIIVPTLNSYRILPNLINSLKNQTSSLWRLLLIDGKSSVEHKKYLKSLSELEKNISILNQDEESPGIYGAMNIGLKSRKPFEWVMFWGSDDIAFSKDIIENLIKVINEKQYLDLDFIFNDAIYINKIGSKKRNASFKILLNNIKLSFFLGFSPPHQGCLFSPKILERRNNFSLDYYLAADLDYFLSTVYSKDIKSIHLPNKVVSMTTGGASGRMIKKRLKEVIMIYKSNFGILFFIPFLGRYIIRLSQFFLK